MRISELLDLLASQPHGAEVRSVFQDRVLKQLTGLTIARRPMLMKGRAFSLPQSTPENLFPAGGRDNQLVALVHRLTTLDLDKITQRLSFVYGKLHIRRLIVRVGDYDSKTTPRGDLVTTAWQRMRDALPSLPEKCPSLFHSQLFYDLEHDLGPGGLYALSSEVGSNHLAKRFTRHYKENVKELRIRFQKHPMPPDVAAAAVGIHEHLLDQVPREIKELFVQPQGLRKRALDPNGSSDSPRKRQHIDEQHSRLIEESGAAIDHSRGDVQPVRQDKHGCPPSPPNSRSSMQDDFQTQTWHQSQFHGETSLHSDTVSLGTEAQQKPDDLIPLPVASLEDPHCPRMDASRIVAHDDDWAQHGRLPAPQTTQETTLRVFDGVVGDQSPTSLLQAPDPMHILAAVAEEHIVFPIDGSVAPQPNGQDINFPSVQDPPNVSADLSYDRWNPDFLAHYDDLSFDPWIGTSGFAF